MTALTAHTGRKCSVRSAASPDCHGLFLNCYLRTKSNPHKRFYFVQNTNSLVDILETQASLVAQLVKILPAMWETWVRSLDQENPWRRDRLPTPVFLGFPGSSVGKESTYNAGYMGSIPEMGIEMGRFAGEGHGCPLQDSGLENSMDCMCVCVLVTQLCLTLCDSMDCSLPGSSVHGILQAEYWGG